MIWKSEEEQGQQRIVRRYHITNFYRFIATRFYNSTAVELAVLYINKCFKILCSKFASFLTYKNNIYGRASFELMSEIYEKCSLFICTFQSERPLALENSNCKVQLFRLFLISERGFPRRKHGKSNCQTTFILIYDKISIIV